MKIIFGLTPSATEKGAKGPQKGQRDPQSSAGARRRGAEHPELLVNLKLRSDNETDLNNDMYFAKILCEYDTMELKASLIEPTVKQSFDDIFNMAFLKVIILVEVLP